MGEDVTPLGARAARALAVVAVTVPAVDVAHRLTSGQAPPASLVLLLGVISSAVLLLPGPAAVLDRGRWTAAAAVGLTQLLGHGLLAAFGATSRQDGCLAVMGRGASAGVRLALLREDAACPPGTLTLSPGLQAGVAALLAALAVACGQAVVSVVAATLLVTGCTAWRAARGITQASTRELARRLDLLADLLHNPLPVPVRARAPHPLDPDGRARLTSAFHPAASLRRGPPCTG